MCIKILLFIVQFVRSQNYLTFIFDVLYDKRPSGSSSRAIFFSILQHNKPNLKKTMQFCWACYYQTASAVICYVIIKTFRLVAIPPTRSLQQCYHLLSRKFGRAGQTILQMRIKIRPLVQKLLSLISFYRTGTKFSNLFSVKICESPDFQFVHKGKSRKTKLFQNSAPFRPFWKNPTTIPKRIFFLCTFLSYATELSASWQHCFVAKRINPFTGVRDPNERKSLEKDPK